MEIINRKKVTLNKGGATGKSETWKVTIPKNIREDMEIKEGEEILFIYDDKKKEIIIKKYKEE